MHYLRASMAVALLIVGRGSGAQELGVHGSGAVDPSGYYGAGASLAGFVRVGSIVGKDLSSLSESKAMIGFRLSTTALRSAETSSSGPACDVICDPYAAQRGIWSHQAVLLLRPYHSSRTRFDVGAGANVYSMRGGPEDGGWGFVATAGLARRIARPLWLALAYDRHGEPFYAGLADGSGSRHARHTVRVGLTYHRPVPE